MRILIAEDEEDLLTLIRDNLLRENYEVCIAENGKIAWDIFLQEEIDLCIFDIMMPIMNGLELIQKIREKSNTPVIFLTARGDEIDRVLGLSLGGDDYLVKPFSMAELKARVQVQKRHIQQYKMREPENTTLHILTCGNITLNLEEVTCYKSNQQITLGAKEFQLLKVFMENQERVFTKKQLYNLVWQDSYLYDDNTVIVHLSRLRSKIEDNPKSPTRLITIRGIGYKFSARSSINTGQKNG